MAEVLTLLEWRLKRNAEVQRRQPKIDSNSMPFGGALQNLVKWLGNELDTNVAADTFYAQPFTPSLIPMLFEGFTKPEDTYLQDGHEAITFDRRGYTIGIDYFQWPPTNLSDFLTDAKRAGLSLSWKPEVVEANPFLKTETEKP